MFCSGHNALFRHVLLALMVTAILNTSLSRGTVLRKLSLDELVSHADTIVVGTCEKTEAIWLDRKIYTVATVRVSRPIKGKAVVYGGVKLYIPGGRVRRPMPVKMHVPGAAKVVQGEEMLLFLKAGGIKKQQHRFVGMAQGKIPIKIDAKMGEKLIRRDGPIKGVKMVDRQGKLLSSSARPESTKEGNLEDFLSKVEQIMAEQKAKTKKTAEQKSQPENGTQNEKGGVK